MADSSASRRRWRSPQSACSLGRQDSPFSRTRSIASSCRTMIASLSYSARRSLADVCECRNLSRLPNTSDARFRSILGQQRRRGWLRSRPSRCAHWNRRGRALECHSPDRNLVVAQTRCTGSRWAAGTSLAELALPWGKGQPWSLRRAYTHPVLPGAKPDIFVGGCGCLRAQGDEASKGRSRLPSLGGQGATGQPTRKQFARRHVGQVPS